MPEVQRPVVTVAELCQRLKRALEGASGRDWVQGEVGSFRQVKSGHCYFNLKDEREEAVLDCVAYRYQAMRMRRHLVDGARLQVFGRATFWAPRGRAQFVVEAARPVGRGDLLERLQRLKEQLQSEGLFDADRKRPLPSHVRHIGVVTSADGAAWHDIRTVSLRRGAVKLTLSSALVQGDAAARSLMQALDRIERHPTVDVVIIGRGGGAFEDLLAFSDERVVRRVAAFRLPIVSAVGHEIDTSLCDLAADARAATPSEAAELVVADETVRARELAHLVATLRRTQAARLEDDRAALTHLRTRIGDPRFLIATKQQWLDDLEGRAERLTRRRVGAASSELHRLQQRLSARHPQVVLARWRQRLLLTRSRLERAMAQRSAAQRQRFLSLDTRLGGLSPIAVLARGYAIVLDERRRAVRSSADVETGHTIEVRLHRGKLDAVVQRVTEPEKQQ